MDYWVSDLGHQLIESVEIQIGGQTLSPSVTPNPKIDPHELRLREWTHAAGLLAGQLFAMRGEDSLFSLLDKDTIRTIILYVHPKPVKGQEICVSCGDSNLYVPLSFWFSRDISVAIPMCADLWAPMYMKVELPALNGDAIVPEYQHPRMIEYEEKEEDTSTLPINDLFE
jgi:hypothetical protein